MYSSNVKLTQQAIQELLAQLQSNAAARTQPASSQPGTGTSAQLGAQFQKLMEVYCIVKVGGVQAQVEAVQAFLQREQAKLEAELAAVQKQEPNSQESQSLQQEIDDLRKTVSWRLSLLQRIHPEEEAAVLACLPEIEQQMTSGSIEGGHTTPFSA